MLIFRNEIRLVIAVGYCDIIFSHCIVCQLTRSRDQTVMMLLCPMCNIRSIFTPIVSLLPMHCNVQRSPSWNKMVAAGAFVLVTWVVRFPKRMCNKWFAGFAAMRIELFFAHTMWCFLMSEHVLSCWNYRFSSNS